MELKFSEKRKWFKAGIRSILYTLAVFFSGIILFISMDADETANRLLMIICTLFILLGIYKALYYFRLPKKDYVVIEENLISIHRGNIIPRKIIKFNRVKRVVQVNEVISLLLSNEREEHIYTDWLSEEDTSQLKKKLQRRFGSKAIAF